jgi:hypothetical protein
MNQSFVVRISQPQGRLHDDPGGLFLRKRSARFDQFAQIHTRDVFGDQVVHTAVLARVMSPDQVGTVEFGLHANLSLKSSQRLVVDPMQWQNFNRTLSTHDFMDRFEDLPHTSLADEVGNHIRPKSKFDLPIRELKSLILGDCPLLDQDASEELVLVDRLPFGLGTEDLVLK